MEIKDLKIVFYNGGLKKATITQNVMDVGIHRDISTHLKHEISLLKYSVHALLN